MTARTEVWTFFLTLECRDRAFEFHSRDKCVSASILSFCYHPVYLHIRVLRQAVPKYKIFYGMSTNKIYEPERREALRRTGLKRHVVILL